MTSNQKYYTVGGITLALIVFFSIKSYAKKTASVVKKKGSIVIGDIVGEFELPALVKSRIGTRLRSDSNTSASIVHTYNSPVEMIVTDDIQESDGRWFKVYDKSGLSGWVRSDVVDY